LRSRAALLDESHVHLEVTEHGSRIYLGAAGVTLATWEEEYGLHVGAEPPLALAIFAWIAALRPE